MEDPLTGQTAAAETPRPSEIATHLAMRAHDLPPDERSFSPVITKVGMVDVAADTAHSMSLIRQRIVARSTGSPNLSVNAGSIGLPPGLEDLKELEELLFGRDTEQGIDPASPLPEAPQT